MRVSSPDAGLDTPAIDLLARLVAFDTVSARSNLALIEAVAAYLREHAVACETVFSDDGAKAGLIASIGPDAPGGIVLSGHTDVVPVDGQVWSSDPFTLVERDGRLFGRGAADMKGFIATALALVPAMTVMPLRVPIHLALSWDEEVGCLGAPRLLAALLARVPKPGCVIVGEPTGMRVADRHRGISTFVTTVRGRGGHSSAPHRGVNAIGAGARIVAELERIGQTLATGRPAADDETPEHTTVNVGRIDGGAAVNMIAEHCRIAWECRPAPGSSADDVRALLDRFVEDDLLPPMRAAAAEAAVSSEEVVSVPPLLVRAPSPAVALALRLSGQNRAVAAPFASEAGLFQAAGVPAVVIGPGWPAQAHQPDEFVSREQITACLAFLRQLADWASHYPETASDSP